MILENNPAICIAINGERTGTAKYIKAKLLRVSAGVIVIVGC
jgi:hypothetical protein